VSALPEPPPPARPTPPSATVVRRERDSRLLPPRLVLLFLVGCLLFGYPFLALFSRPTRVAGIPVLFVYIFVVWGLFIAALARLVDSGGRGR
jgi:hypothetical protein